MTNGASYLCDWEEVEKNTYKVFLVEHPHIYAISKYWLACEFDLYSDIVLHFGDTEATLDYVKKLPENIVKPAYTEPSYSLLTFNYGYRFAFGQLANYFDGGQCDVCKQAIGKRNDEQLLLADDAKNTDVIFIEQTNIKVVSEQLLAFLEKYNDGFFTARPVAFQKAKRKKFYEIIWSDNVDKVSAVAVKDPDIGLFHGWKCSSCEAGNQFYQVDYGICHFAEESSLTESKLMLYNNKDIIISSGLAAEIKHIKFKKLVLEQLGIVDGELVNKSPDIDIRLPKKKVKPKLP